MKRAIIGVVLLAAIGAGAWYYYHRPQQGPSFTTVAVTRGSIVKVVAATGTLQSVVSVNVGAEVSGIVATLGADYNSIVKKGQVLATLDPSLFKTAVEQSQANLDAAKAEVERLKAAQVVADVTLGRDQSLAKRELLAAQDLQTAETDSRSAKADVAAAEAKVVQAQADLSNAQVNLSKSVITSPIDGVVTSRSVDIGQTVASSFNTPTLFIIAADLTKLQIAANIDESDVGMMKNGQDVTFRVDAFPNDTFHGTVAQVRLNAATVNNVVTYTTIIDAPNPQLKLKPGMTANLTVEISRVDNVLRVPAAALRFRPPQQGAPASSPAPKQAPTGTPAGGGLTHASATRGPNAPPTVWRTDGVGLFPVKVQTGLSDGTFTELINPPFGEATMLVTQAK
jgi:HlyD family secretion protein